MVSRQSGSHFRLAGLERAARMAGEAFGHEDLGSLPANDAAAPGVARFAGLFASLAAAFGSMKLR